MKKMEEEKRRMEEEKNAEIEKLKQSIKKLRNIPLGLFSFTFILTHPFPSSDPSSFTFPNREKWTIDGITVRHSISKENEWNSFQIPTTIDSVCFLSFHSHSFIHPFIHRAFTNCFSTISYFSLSSFPFHLHHQNSCCCQCHIQSLFVSFPFPIHFIHHIPHFLD